ncbi:MAG: ester cyclase [Chloroflexi bacterium]|nr:ester cyclase [Chloroflexota bacterium]
MPTPAENKAAVLKFYEESHRGNLEVYDTMIAPDFINHGVGPIPDMKGPEAFKQAYIMYITAFPDFDTPPQIVIAEGDYVMLYGPATGTHLGDFMGLPPTGKKLQWSGVSIYRFNQEGKIVERWQELNALGLMQQLGVIPPMGGGR